ncbi:MAG: hypothetical protein WBA69_04735 [Mycobacterium sp.]
MSTHLITGSIIGIVTFGAVAFAGVYSPRSPAPTSPPTAIRVPGAFWAEKHG